MKQFIVFDHFFNRKDIVETDVVPTVFDCIVPQKTTIVFAQKINISDEDIVLIRDSETLNVDYLGVCDTVEKDTNTRVAILPFIAICDNELQVETLNAEAGGTDTVQLWISRQILANFVNTDDVYSKFNIQVRDNTNTAIYYKAVDDTSNLLDALNEVYLNTGLYVDFSIGTTQGAIDKIYCDIYNANEQPVKKIRYDNPQIIDKVDYKFSQYGNYSKCTISVGDTGRTFAFYLRQDNKVTTNPEDQYRIKKVKNKNIELTAEYSSEDELAEALALMAQKTLCGDAFAYSIEFNITRKAISDWQFRQRCDFMAEDRLYQSYITNITYLNDKTARVTLGAYRYTLTDKFKALAKDRKEIGNTFNGIAVSNALGSTTFWFTQENGNLYLNYPEGETAPNFEIEYGNLYYTYNNSEPDFEVEDDGELVYKY